MRYCRAPGCNARVRSTRSGFCNLHGLARSRNGHPLQKAIPKETELLYLHLLIDHIARLDTARTVWESVDRATEILLEDARKQLRTYDSGAVMNLNVAKACKAIVAAIEGLPTNDEWERLRDAGMVRKGLRVSVRKMDDVISPRRKLALKTAAVLLMRFEDPALFRDDTAVRFLMVNTFRNGAGAVLQKAYRSQTGGLCYRTVNLSNRTYVQIFSDMLMAAYGKLGLVVHQSWERNRQRQKPMEAVDRTLVAALEGTPA